MGSVKDPPFVSLAVRAFQCVHFVPFAGAQTLSDTRWCLSRRLGRRDVVTPATRAGICGSDSLPSLDLTPRFKMARDRGFNFLQV